MLGVRATAEPVTCGGGNSQASPPTIRSQRVWRTTLRPFQALAIGVVVAVIGGFLLVVGGDGVAFFGLVLVAIGGFFELVAAVAYGTVIAQRELQGHVTAPTEIRALLQYLDSTEDPEQQKLRPIADGLGLRMPEARRQVEGAVEAGAIEPVGSSGRFVVTAAGLQLLKERNG